jgi:hypothetical protein
MARFGPTGTVGTSDDPNFAPTLRLVEQTLAGAPTLPGAVPAVHAPAAALTAPFGYRADGNLIDRAAFWTAPGTPTDAIEYLTTNLPFGMTLSGTGSSGHTKTDRMEKQVVMYDGPVTSPSQWLELQISVVRSGSGVAVRADATGVWLPTKPAAEYIGTVSSVDVTVYRPTATAGAPTVHRTLTGVAAQRLADAIDALPLPTPQTRTCLTGRPFSDEFVFHAASRTIAAVNRVDGCGGVVTVTINGAGQPNLSGNIDMQVTAELGLPADYGN